MTPNRYRGPRFGFRAYRDDGTFEPVWATPLRMILGFMVWGLFAVGLAKIGFQIPLGPFGPYLATALPLVLLLFLLRVGIAQPFMVTFPSLVVAFSLVLLGYAYLFSKLGLVGPGEVATQGFRDCLYFSVVTFTTLGYGDFRPTPAARPVAAIEALTGYIAFGLFVAFMTSRWSTPLFPRWKEDGSFKPKGPDGTA